MIQGPAPGARHPNVLDNRLLLQLRGRLWLGLCKLEIEILKEAKNGQKWPKMIIIRPKNVIFGCF